MKKGSLIIEMGKITGKQGLEVYERFKREVDEQWKKLQETQIPKSRALGSRKAIEEHIVVKALDGFLPPLPAKESLEREIRESISNVAWDLIVQMDGDHTLNELKAMCKEKGLNYTGDKKLLAWRLLKYNNKI